MNRRPALALVVFSSLVLAAPRWNQGTDGAREARGSPSTRWPRAASWTSCKWMAAREEVARAAGVPATQLYAHLDGDRWDYLVIWPITTAEQDRKMDEQAAAKGLKTGFPAALEFRELLASHTDTYVAGPDDGGRAGGRGGEIADPAPRPPRSGPRRSRRPASAPPARPAAPRRSRG